MVKKIILLIFISSLMVFNSYSENSVTIARVQYKGGGDWYNDRTMLPNMLKRFTKETGIPTGKEVIVTLDSLNFFSYPILFITGHGNIFFDEKEITNLRNYLYNGGFLYVDDDCGLDKFFRREIAKIFPEKELIELPLNHILYNIKYKFPKGTPKIHEHYPGPPHTFAILDGERIMVLYTYNSNISDGWNSPEVYNDPPEIREKAFQMGVNILLYALTE